MNPRVRCFDPDDCAHLTDGSKDGRFVRGNPAYRLGGVPLVTSKSHKSELSQLFGGQPAHSFIHRSALIFEIKPDTLNCFHRPKEEVVQFDEEIFRAGVPNCGAGPITIPEQNDGANVRGFVFRQNVEE